MKKIPLYGFIFAILGMSILSGCSGDFARRADGTCVFVCGGGDTGANAVGG